MLKSVVSLAISSLFLFGHLTPCLAQESGGGSGEADHHCHHETETACHSQPVNLDLSSSIASATAGCVAQSPVNINVGGSIMTVTQGMALTPAQLVAAYQVARTGEQSLLLGADGSAIGGSFIIGSRLAQNLSELVIPTNVTAINRAADLNLVGNLTNAGTIQAIASNPNISTVNISANNIFNSGMLNSLLNLNLFAINDIINSGSIISAGTLSMTAGGSIQNIAGNGAALLQAVSAMTMQAPQVINQGSIVSQMSNANFVTNSLINSGNIQAMSGNVDIAAHTGNNLDISNIAGQIAARDTISMVTGATLFNGQGLVLDKAGIDFNGGKLSAQDITFTSLEGQVEVSADRIDGSTIINAGVANIGVQSGTLNVGLNLTGDPIITNSGGDIVLTTNFNPGTASDYIVLAAGSISAGGGFNTIATSGGNVVLSAGYLFTGVNSNCTSCSGTYSISRTQSDTGGTINLSGVSINTTGLNGTNGSSGGSPTAGGNGDSSGNITVQSPGSVALGTLTSSGSSGGVGGSGTGVSTNGANGGNGAYGGNISIYSGNSLSVSGSITAIGGSGGAGGTGASDSGSSAGGNGGVGGTGGNGGSIYIEALGDVSVTGNLFNSGSTGGVGGAGGASDSGIGGNGGNGGNGGSAAAITVKSQGSISTPSNIETAGSSGGAGGSGGDTGIITGGPAGNGGDGGNAGNAGSVLLKASGSIVALRSGDLIVEAGAGGVGGIGGTGAGGNGNGGGNGSNTNGGVATLIAGTTVGTVAEPLNNQILARNNGVVLIQAGDTSSQAINIGSSFAIATGSLAFITGYGTTAPVITKVLPIFNYNYNGTDLSGSGINAAVGANFNVRNDITIAQNPNGTLDIANIGNTGGEGIYTATVGNISAASSGSLDTSTGVGQDVIIIGSGQINSSNQMFIDVSAPTGDRAGGQIIIVPGLGSSGPFVTGNSGYTNPFLILPAGTSTANVALQAVGFTSTGNLFYASGENVAIGAVMFLGNPAVTEGANGLPGGQVFIGATGLVNFDNTIQAGVLFLDGAPGAGSVNGIGGNGGMGGIINIITSGLIQLEAGAQANGGDAGTGVTDGNSGNGGIIQLNSALLISRADICACSGLGANGNGGNISITTSSALFDFALGGDNNDNFVNGVMRADSLVNGNGGSISLNTAGAININFNALVSAKSGTTGGIGGSISLTSDGLILSAQAELDASGQDAGGSIRLSANNSIASVSDIISARGQLGSQSVGGTIYISAQNSIDLDSTISANGNDYGGTINILSNGTITNNGTIAANTAGGATYVGGKIQISTVTPGAGPVTLVNNGGITATNIGGNTTGRVGINGGANSITISGNGSITGNQFVNIGDLDPTTLAINQPFSEVDNFSGVYQQGNISISQAAIIGKLQVSGSGPVPTASAAAITIIPPGFNPLLYLYYLAQLQYLSQLQTASLYEQLGTRIATDYTPYTTFPMQPQFINEAPLRGTVNIEQLADIGEALFATSSFNANELAALTNAGIQFGPKTGGNFFDLNKGYVLFMPTNDIQVQTKEGLVSIPKGAIVWVMETGNDAAVYDLHDSINAPVKITANGKEMTLSPGTQVLMTRDSKGSFEALNPGSSIGTRNVRSKDLGGGIKAYIADFSISGGVMNVGVIRSLLKSDNPEHHKAAMKMLKNAAILADLTGGAGAYKTKGN
ncbi:MAG: hypothetical protein K2W82_04580 [Candidatus Obscuribacterales bacterium]|nr:hypothetical protein [Candidatus Obscuribacterales bacterium]